MYIRSIKTYLQYCRRCITMLLYYYATFFEAPMSIVQGSYTHLVQGSHLQGSRIASITYLFLNGPHMSSYFLQILVYGQFISHFLVLMFIQ